MKVKLPMILLGLIAVTACRSDANSSQPHREPSKIREMPASQEQRVGYEPGDWLLHTDLNTLLIAGDHILISHRDTKPTKRMVSGIASSRTREEARRKVFSLYADLIQHPERFAAVARRQSDDPPSARAGGSLGTFYALAVPEPLLNAFAAIEVGEVSRPVETAQGFHLVKREKPAPESELSLSHIVIKYDTALGWKRADRALPNRTQAQAREIAIGVVEKARQHPDRYGHLALEYSEADDALREGDMGTWSTYEDIGSDFLLLSVASRLPIGGISNVVETPTGAHVVLRKPPLAKQTAAASAIVVPHEETQLSNIVPALAVERPKQEAKKIAAALVATLKRQPQKFEELRSRYCEAVSVMCREVNRWYLRRNVESIEREYARLRLHGISATPVDSPLGYVILRREDSEKHGPPTQLKPQFNFANAFLKELETGT